MAATGGSIEKCFKETATHLKVKEFYGKVLKKTTDLKTDACVASSGPVPAHIRHALNMVHPEVIAKYYGCGLVVPECMEACQVLDLGSGSGRDCYMLSKLVGEKGNVTGIDMTEKLLEVARTYTDYHTQAFGYKAPNIRFVQGYLEALNEAGIEGSAYDICISNGAVNLCPDKKPVLQEAYRVLKEGGELYFSDVYSSGRLTEEIRNSNVLWGECLSGALWWEDLMQLAEEVGFSPPRFVSGAAIKVFNKEMQDILGDFKFLSATYRLFKVPRGAGKPREVVYQGGITGMEESFSLDSQYTFKVNEVVEVDGDVAEILTRSRFSDKFTMLPPGGPSQTCGASPKAGAVNPFELIHHRSDVPGSTTGGCCGTQPTGCCN
ncbi:arsenite methyltransferase [Gadus morhua]|uniref:Arsenite methyltransferase n=2 Tax=Gadus TaxID=8048 RepID=A0A8C4ZDF2_GADMO|nr:arsenite methyltransferase-like [Gadus morhua]XP_059930402.1 arsenite methyltransferase-like isoform X1 [Gadus macrocephalus]